MSKSGYHFFPDFSYMNWLSDRNLTQQVLSEVTKRTLFEELGIASYMNAKKCYISETPFAPASSGWNLGIWLKYIPVKLLYCHNLKSWQQYGRNNLFKEIFSWPVLNMNFWKKVLLSDLLSSQIVQFRDFTGSKRWFIYQKKVDCYRLRRI